jgi:hypothetical protein
LGNLHRGFDRKFKISKNEGGIVASWEGETATTSATDNAYGYLICQKAFSYRANITKFIAIIR